MALLSTPAYTGIGRFTLDGNCTAFLIRTPGSGAAYALTAGHCVARNANEVIVDRAVSGRSVIFNFFAETRDRQMIVPVRRVAYSTMKGRDLALLELTGTQSELAERGVRALELAPAEPSAGAPISVVGAPASFFNQREWFLRRANCTLGRRADLLEFVWHFWDVRRNDCADMVGGFSGSPVIDEANGDVVGILNTTTYLAWQGGGDFDCYLGRPCEIGAGGQHVEEDTSYSTPVTGVLACFRADGVFELTLASCPLDRGRQLNVTRRTRSQKPGGTWAATLAGDLPFYRWKGVVAGVGDCRDESGYSSLLSLAERPEINVPMPLAENRYLLCVAGAEQPVKDATVVNVRVDETPPVVEPRYTVRDEDERYRIAFEFAPPELSSYSYKFGPPGVIRCDEPGYAIYRRVPLVLPKSEGPYRFCFYAEEEAGNTSPAVDFVLGADPLLLPGGVATPFASTRPQFAPGSWLALYGLALEQAQVRLRDAAGRVIELTQAYRAATQINVLLPANLVLGPAQILVGDRAEPIELVEMSPSLRLAS